MSDKCFDNGPGRLLKLLSSLSDTLKSVQHGQQAVNVVLHYLATMFPRTHCNYFEFDDDLQCVRITASVAGALADENINVARIPFHVFKVVDPAASPLIYECDQPCEPDEIVFTSVIAPVEASGYRNFIALSGTCTGICEPNTVATLSLVSSICASQLDRLFQMETQRDYLGRLLETLDEFTREPDIFLRLGQRLAALAEHYNASSATMWSYIPDQNVLHYAAGYSGRSGDSRAPQSTDAVIDVTDFQELWRDLLTSRRPVIRTRLSGFQTLPTGLQNQLNGGERLLLVPMLTGNCIAGLLTFTDGEFEPAAGGSFNSVLNRANEFGMGIHLHRLTRQSSEVALLKERNRLAREIHDTLAQGFTGIIMWLEAARLNLPDNPKTALEHMQKAKGVARESLTEARRSIWALRPSILQEYEIHQAIPQLAERLTRDSGHDICFALHGSPRDIPARCEDALLRIAQEAITNVLRHADAAIIRIELEYLKRSVRLQIADDGGGFNLETMPHSVGFGMTSMKERAEQLAGTLTVDNRPEGGALLTVEIPF